MEESPIHKIEDNDNYSDDDIRSVHSMEMSESSDDDETIRYFEEKNKNLISNLLKLNPEQTSFSVDYTLPFEPIFFEEKKPSPQKPSKPPKPSRYNSREVETGTTITEESSENIYSELSIIETLFAADFVKAFENNSSAERFIIQEGKIISIPLVNSEDDNFQKLLDRQIINTFKSLMLPEIANEPIWTEFQVLSAERISQILLKVHAIQPIEGR